MMIENYKSTFKLGLFYLIGWGEGGELVKISYQVVLAS